eukprot:GEMP01048186.1.p1 GENE.GEMP01048186.1~~GEMP01048186.1.p1  ORF type:complete len:224 (+),score=52.23 GEMP01048186.1:147-818(+)
MLAASLLRLGLSTVPARCEERSRGPPPCHRGPDPDTPSHSSSDVSKTAPWRIRGWPATSMVHCEGLELIKKDDYAKQKLSDSYEYFKTSEGVRYRDMKVGEGRECTSTCIVFVHYEGKYANGRPFESTWKRSPQWLTLQMGNCPFAALDIALVGMREGGKREVIMPPHLCHEEVDEIMIYEVQLFRVEHPEALKQETASTEYDTDSTLTTIKKRVRRLFEPRV